MYEIEMKFMIKITGNEPSSAQLKDEIEMALMSIKDVRDVVILSFKKDMEIYEN